MRQEEVLDTLREHGPMTIEELAKHFSDGGYADVFRTKCILGKRLNRLMVYDKVSRVEGTNSTGANCYVWSIAEDVTE